MRAVNRKNATIQEVAEVSRKEIKITKPNRQQAPVKAIMELLEATLPEKDTENRFRFERARTEGKATVSRYRLTAIGKKAAIIELQGALGQRSIGNINFNRQNNESH